MRMVSALGWYGPLIDLSSASSHVGDFVQLLVFVRRCVPVQVGDDTRSYFMVSIWQKNMGSMVSAGNIILLQNVKIAMFGNVLEARTVQWSSLLCLIHSYESLISEGIEQLISGCRVGTTTKDKLRKVVNWVRQSGSCLRNIMLDPNQQAEYLPKNWKVLEERQSKECFSLSEVSQLTTSCTAIVYASIGEIFLQVTPVALGDIEKEELFLSRRVFQREDNNLVQDLICTGCHLCGLLLEQNAIPPSCSKSSSRLHTACSIYRPFMLYVWDESDYMPVLVKNKAAEILFGNIKAEKVYSTYREPILGQASDSRHKSKDKDSDTRVASNVNISGGALSSFCSLEANNRLQLEGSQHHGINLNFYRIWLIFLKLLLQQGKNSSLKFEIAVDPSRDKENGKFELISASMPCFEPGETS